MGVSIWSAERGQVDVTIRVCGESPKVADTNKREDVKRECGQVEGITFSQPSFEARLHSMFFQVFFSISLGPLRFSIELSHEFLKLFI